MKDNNVYAANKLAGQQSEMETAQSLLDDEIRMLRSLIEDLAVRLGPVLRHDRELASPVCEVKMPEMESIMASSLVGQSQNLNTLVGRLTNLLHRLAV